VSGNSSSAEEGATKRNAKSRSQSRKRASIFGSLLGGKKEESEEKKELRKEEKADKEERKEEKMIEREELKAGTHEHRDGVAGTSLDAEAIGKSRLKLFSLISTLLTWISGSGGDRARGSCG